MCGPDAYTASRGFNPSLTYCDDNYPSKNDNEGIISINIYNYQIYYHKYMFIQSPLYYVYNITLLEVDSNVSLGSYFVIYLISAGGLTDLEYLVVLGSRCPLGVFQGPILSYWWF